MIKDENIYTDVDFEYKDVDFDKILLTDGEGRCSECFMKNTHKLTCSQRYSPADICPDAYQFIRITPKDSDQSIIKLFAVWVGGYSGTDSWRLNSGVQDIEICPNHVRVYGYSGSCYCIHKVQVHMSAYGSKVLSGIVEQASTIGATVEYITLEQAYKEIKNV